MHKQMENLSMEQMREIVEGAPEGAQLYKTHFNLVGYAKLQTHFVFMATTTFKNGFGDKAVWKIMGCRSVLKFKPKKFNKLEDLRTAIAEHDSREFKVGDKIVMIKSYAYDDVREIKELCDSGKVCITTDGRKLRLSLSSGYMVHRHATTEEIEADHRLEVEHHG